MSAQDYKTQMRRWRVRRQKMVEMREQGLKLDQIAQAFRITRQRVHQILRDYA